MDHFKQALIAKKVNRDYFLNFLNDIILSHIQNKIVKSGVK